MPDTAVYETELAYLVQRNLLTESERRLIESGELADEEVPTIVEMEYSQ
jgi:hypothetical protein